MQANNASRKERMAKLTATRVGTCQEINDANIDKVNSWIGDRLEWAETMMESYLKKHLIAELQATQASVVGQLQARTD